MKAVHLGVIVVAVVISVVVASYYIMSLKKNYAGAKLETLFFAAEKKMSSVKSKSSQIGYVYGNEIKKARIAFLNGHGYWKNIYISNLIAVISLYREDNYKKALTLLKINKGLHPYFINTYKVAGLIFNDLGLVERSQVCEQIYEHILQGDKFDKEVVDKCIL